MEKCAVAEETRRARAVNEARIVNVFEGIGIEDGREGWFVGEVEGLGAMPLCKKLPSRSPFSR